MCVWVGVAGADCELEFLLGILIVHGVLGLVFWATIALLGDAQNYFMYHLTRVGHWLCHLVVFGFLLSGDACESGLWLWLGLSITLPIPILVCDVEFEVEEDPETQGTPL
jgi:hypothetical protein